MEVSALRSNVMPTIAERRRERAESMCSNFWPCTDHPMDHGLNGHCLKGLCPGDRRPPPPHKVHLAPIGRYNYPRRHSKLFIAANSASLACKAARQVELSLRAKEMHFCTGSTGQALRE
ncbi:hypothetical protein V6N12_062228 [Hibiscus sabdariffa]|uniref:Uncharacterized protein n=1 Tax=Hibiscus sabdariffa TaxID=183260 RepID=A0ABR2F883_9ROSI